MKLKILKFGVVLTNLLVIGLLVYLFVNIATIPLIEPADGVYTTERRPEFVWNGLHNEYDLFLDDDPGFTSPFSTKVSGNSFRFVNDLNFGTYYWKVNSGVFSSGVRKLTIGSSVSLSRAGDDVKNSGNVDLVLHRLTGSFVLGVDESLEVGEEENVKAEQV
ncbi:MAG: hypothetical protein GTN76_07850 [Candidatus Aenigmarchaeota archaeon]|nr:hypothetical protein [Candidatus Aenigmarchaeota archaeon]